MLGYYTGGYKMIRFLFFLVFLLLHPNAIGNNTPEPGRFSLSGDIVGIPLGAYGVRAQYHWVNHITLTLPINMSVSQLNTLPTVANNIIKIFGYGILPTFRITGGIGLMFDYGGWYIEPGISLGYAKMNYPEFEKSMFLVAPNVFIGHQSIIASKFLINIAIGIVGLYYFPHITGTNAWIPVSTFSLGYVF